MPSNIVPSNYAMNITMILPLLGHFGYGTTFALCNLAAKDRLTVETDSVQDGSYPIEQASYPKGRIDRHHIARG